MRAGALVVAVAACSGSHSSGGVDAATSDVAAADAMPDSPAASGGLGTVSNATTVTCPMGAPANATCTQVIVNGCPSIETESITATLALVAQTGTLKGTIVHFSGGGGTAFQTDGGGPPHAARFQQ